MNKELFPFTDCSKCSTDWWGDWVQAETGVPGIYRRRVGLPAGTRTAEGRGWPPSRDMIPSTQLPLSLVQNCDTDQSCYSPVLTENLVLFYVHSVTLWTVLIVNDWYFVLWLPEYLLTSCKHILFNVLTFCKC